MPPKKGTGAPKGNQNAKKRKEPPDLTPPEVLACSPVPQARTISSRRAAARVLRPALASLHCVTHRQPRSHLIMRECWQELAISIDPMSSQPLPPPLPPPPPLPRTSGLSLPWQELVTDLQPPPPRLLPPPSTTPLPISPQPPPPPPGTIYIYDENGDHLRTPDGQLLMCSQYGLRFVFCVLRILCLIRIDWRVSILGGHSVLCICISAFASVFWEYICIPYLYSVCALQISLRILG